MLVKSQPALGSLQLRRLPSNVDEPDLTLTDLITQKKIRPPAPRHATALQALHLTLTHVFMQRGWKDLLVLHLEELLPPAR